MKKFFALLICLIVTLSLCACGTNGAKNDNTDGNSSSLSSVNGTNDNTDNSSVSGEAEYYGTWKHERTDAEPFQMTIELNAGGKGKNSNTDIEWTYDEATKQISIIIIYPDGSKSEPSNAKLTDGKICWEREFNIKTQSGEFVKFDKAFFEKQ